MSTDPSQLLRLYRGFWPNVVEYSHVLEFLRRNVLPSDVVLLICNPIAALCNYVTGVDFFFGVQMEFRKSGDSVGHEILIWKVVLLRIQNAGFEDYRGITRDSADFRKCADAVFSNQHNHKVDTIIAEQQLLLIEPTHVKTSNI